MSQIIQETIISYWHQNTARYEEYKTSCLYIPQSGAAFTIAHELMRCVSNLLHEYANNGNGNALDQKDYFYGKFNYALNFIRQVIPKAKKEVEQVRKLMFTQAEPRFDQAEFDVYNQLIDQVLDFVESDEMPY